MSIETIANNLSFFQQRLVVGGVCGILTAGAIGLCSPKTPAWLIGLGVAPAIVWTTEWRGKRRQRPDEPLEAMPKPVREYHETLTKGLQTINSQRPGSREALDALNSAATVFQHAAGRAVAETFLEVRDAPLPMPSDRQESESSDAFAFDPTPGHLEPEVNFEEVLLSWEREFPDAPLATGMSTSSFDDLLQNTTK